MKILVTGATGSIGSETVHQALEDPEITEVTAITRKPLDFEHPKLRVVIHQNFLDYTPVLEEFKNHDAIIWALGISQTQVTEDQLFVITHDYALAAAQTIQKTNPNLTFVFVSGEGADPTGKSRFPFGRAKGKTEVDLQALGLKKLYIARPGAVQLVHKKKNLTWNEFLVIPLIPILKLFSPNSVITTVELGKALVKIAKTLPTQALFRNKDLLQI